MDRLDVVRERFYTQHLAGAGLEKPEDIVQWLGAVQSQDYAGAKWSIGQRVKDCTDADVDQAFASGRILRTHVLRPTWHFVTPTDIRWMLQLTAPRVHASIASYYRKQELDNVVLSRSHTVFTEALQGGNRLTRKELGSWLAQTGIATNALRLSFITLHAELEQLICSGPILGKQHTYMLLEERAPEAKTLTRDEALAELTLRFFRSHGPATIKDYRWWSSLTVADARAGLEMVKQHLTHDIVDGLTYWRAAPNPPPRPTPTAAHFLPEYDESHIAYKDLKILLANPGKTNSGSRMNMLERPINIGTYTVGTWKRTIEKGRLALTAKLFTSPTPVQTSALEAAAKQYGAFMNMPVTLVSSVASSAETLN